RWSRSAASRPAIRVRPAFSSAARSIWSATFSPTMAHRRSDTKKPGARPGFEGNGRGAARSGGAGNPGGKRRLGRSAHLDVGDFTALEHGERRNGPHAELGGEFRVLVDIELGDLH